MESNNGIDIQACCSSLMQSCSGPAQTMFSTPQKNQPALDRVTPAKIVRATVTVNHIVWFSAVPALR